MPAFYSNWSNQSTSCALLSQTVEIAKDQAAAAAV